MRVQKKTNLSILRDKINAKGFEGKIRLTGVEDDNKIPDYRCLDFDFCTFTANNHKHDDKKEDFYLTINTELFNKTYDLYKNNEFLHKYFDKKLFVNFSKLLDIFDEMEFEYYDDDNSYRFPKNIFYRNNSINNAQSTFLEILSLRSSIKKWNNIINKKENDSASENCSLCKDFVQIKNRKSDFDDFDMYETSDQDMYCFNDNFGDDEDDDDKSRINCDMCPVKHATGYDGCKNSPYMDWVKHQLTHGRKEPDFFVECDECVNLARKELEFLQKIYDGIINVQPYVISKPEWNEEVQIVEKDLDDDLIPTVSNIYDEILKCNEDNSI